MSDDFLRAWRRVTMALGYRTVGKAVASVKPNGAKPAVTVLPTRCPDCERKAHRRINGGRTHRLNKTESREYADRLWLSYIDCRYKGRDGFIAHREAMGDFRWRSYLRAPDSFRAVDTTSARLQLYKAKKCCGEPMGIMESWGGTTAVYQCAVNAKHTEPAIRKPGIAEVKPGIDYGLKAPTTGAR
jgi:hypothetical protein